MTELCGWVPMPDEVEAILDRLSQPYFGSAAPDLAGSGAGKDVFLWEAEIKVLGKTLPANKQTLGTCVSQGWGRGAQDLMLVQIANEGLNEEWQGEVATEPIYAGSRMEIGRGRLGNGEGSLGAWAADWVVKFGILLRKKYGEHDLTKPDDNLAQNWGTQRGGGVPDVLEPTAKEHPVKTVSLVTTYEQARDSIAGALSPVPVCSNRGFTMTRDSAGFCKPSGVWNHCMLFRGSGIAKGNRPFLALQQSWGESPTGNAKVALESGREVELPQGVFCVDADVCNSMLKQEDSFGMSAFVGWKRQTPNFSPW